MSHVDTSAGDEACHPWINGRLKAGYGRFNLYGKTYSAHRWLLGHLRGEPLRWDDELHEMACHHCDNPPCCNPTHLYVGTAKTNVEDAVARGNHATVAEAAKTHCKKGHEFVESNIYRHPASGSRQCRECRKMRQRKPGRGPKMADRIACPQGHPYDEANTHIRKNGSRDCKACQREAARARRAARKASA